MAIEERKKRERDKLRQLIIDTAEQIILKDGLENLSIRKIANRIEYSPAIIYHYFKDKNDIVDQLMGANYLKIIEALKIDSALDLSPENKLKLMTRSYIDTALSMPDNYMMVQLSSSQEMQRFVACMYEGASKSNRALIMLCECLRNIRREKELSEAEIELMAQIIVSSTFGLIAKLTTEKNIGTEQKEKLIDYFINNTLIKIAGGKTSNE